MNCQDGSDESIDQECQDNRFYCETFEDKNLTKENPLFVSKSLLFDGKKDCADGTDECPSFYNQDMFSSGNEMISKVSLKIILWIIAPFAFFGNVAVLITTIYTLRTVKLNTISIAHRFMVINLSVADGLMGVYLIILTVVSTLNSGSFCLASREWRSSILCKAMGTMVIISSQASVFILQMMGLFRLYTILRPFEAQFSETMCKGFRKGVAFSWLIAIALGIIPWFFDFFITDYHYDSVFFPTDQVSKTDYDVFVEKMTSIASFHSIDENSTIVVQKNFSANDCIVYKQFMSKPMPDTRYSGSFGFYSHNSICLPSYFTRVGVPGWQYSIAIISLNFSMFLLMAVVYFLIAYYGSPTRHPALKATSKRCIVNGKYNFQKCPLHRRVARLIFTDFFCWIPLCILSYTYFSGVDFDNFVIAICGIVLLPINSALNPILYSGLFESALVKTRRFFCKKKFIRSISLSTQRSYLNSSFTSHLQKPRAFSNSSSNSSMRGRYKAR